MAVHAVQSDTILQIIGKLREINDIKIIGGLSGLLGLSMKWHK